MPLVKTKYLGQTGERTEEDREESDFQFMLRFWERAGKVKLKKKIW